MIKSRLINTPRVWLMRTSPRLYVFLAKAVARKLMFPNERRMLGGVKVAGGEGPSVLHFVYNRCGSRYVSGIMQTLLAERGALHVDLERYCGHCLEGDRSVLKGEGLRDTLLQEEGFLYGPFYKLHEGFRDLAPFKIVLNLRDPRDVLTSRFFSQAYAHTLFHEGNIKRRAEVQEMGIDAFVLAEADEILDRYQTYFRELVGRPNVLFLPYEEMVGDFENWLTKLAGFLDIDPDGPAAKVVLEEADFTTKKEDKFSHKRSVTPGNHRKKLKRETIVEIEKKLAEVIKPFAEWVVPPLEDEEPQ